MSETHTTSDSIMMYDVVNVYTPEKFNVRRYILDKGTAAHHRQYKARKTGNKQYCDIISSFDIETTADHDIEQSFMYVWMLSLDENVIIGRTWEQYIKVCEEIAGACEDIDAYLPVFVHNFSYEFHFLRGVMDFEHAFAVRRRKILKAVAYRMEYRCTYFLTQLSLEKLTSKYNVKHAKSKMDYSIYRTPSTPLTPDETTYIVNDVIGLSESIRCQMAAWGDDIYSLPVTQTGYVRREVKKRMNYKKLEVQKHFPEYEVYNELLAAFRGGNTHANRMYAGSIIKMVQSIDIASSYPAQMLFKRFPMTRFKKFSRRDNTLSDKLLTFLLSDKNTALLMRVKFYDIECKSTFGLPYLSVHKCLTSKCIEDNGRVLYALYCETVCTDIDFKIINEHYTYSNIEIETVYTSRYGYLYKEMTDFIKELFKNKTELKNVDDDLYMRSKEMINSVYGLCAERTLHECYELIDNKIEEKQIEDVVEEYAKQGKRAYKLYAWGVWVTSHARDDLQRMVNHVHDNGTFLYADTDSVKYTGNVNVYRYNIPLIRRAKEAGAVGTTKGGTTKYCGIWEHEGYYNSFATLGAKKYAYVDLDGKLHITVSGVSKVSGAHEIADNGGIKTFCDAFKGGFTFDIAGGTGVTFNDDTEMWIKRKGENIRITPNAYIYDDVYKLSATSDYQRIVDTCVKALKKRGN